MKIIETTIFKCDYCGKRQFRKCDMSRHEKWCKKNPVNMHKCFQYCIHLVKDRVDIEPDGNEYGATSRCNFSCTELKKQLYSFHAERRGLVKYLNGIERMPLECASYKDADNIYPYINDDLNF